MTIQQVRQRKTKETEGRFSCVAMFVGNMTRNNIFFWAHSSNRNGEDTKGYGFRDMLKNDSDRCITVFKINYLYKWETGGRLYCLLTTQQNRPLVSR